MPASTTGTQNSGSLVISMSESSAMQGKEAVIISKKPEGNRVLFVPKILFDGLPLKHAGNNLRNCWGGNKGGPAYYSLFDKFKRENDRDPTGSNSKKEQRVPMMGSYSQICRAGSLCVKVNRSYAACISKNSGKKQGNTKLLSGCFGGQSDMCISDMCIQDKRVVSGLLFIGVGDVTTGFVGDEKISDPLPLPDQNKNYLPLEFYSLPSRRSVQPSIDDSCICNERGLSKLDLNGPAYHPSSSAIISSSDPSRIQNAAEDPALITDKSEQDSPVSVLDKFFEDASPRPAQITTQPVKPRNQPLHINFDEPSPGQRVKLHPATTSGYSSPSKNHALLSGAAEYSRKVLAASGLLDWYQLALKWHCSTDQMLDTATYTMLESESESESESPLETQLLFDHINEVLLDMYQPYYPWVPLGRPNNSKQHVLVKRKLVDEVINIVEGNLLLLIREQQQAPVQHQKLAVSAMEKCGRWMDISGELEDMVLEMAEEIEEEIIDEFVFEQWID